jgi:hypothetical protein
MCPTIVNPPVRAGLIIWVWHEPVYEKWEVTGFREGSDGEEEIEAFRFNVHRWFKPGEWHRTMDACKAYVEGLPTNEEEEILQKLEDLAFCDPVTDGVILDLTV